MMPLSDHECSTADLITAFGWDALQQDANGLTRTLLSSVEARARGTSQSDLVARLFRGRSRRIIKCLLVPFERETDEVFYGLQLDVRSTLGQSFATYLEVETLDGANSYNTETEFGRQCAELGRRLVELPPFCMSIFSGSATIRGSAASSQ
jgi:hypothetical protein